MKLYCPHCGVKGVADDSYRGKKVKCPKCLETFIAVETVAADMKAADEQPAEVATEDLRSVESQADLRDEEEILNEPAAPAEEATPAEAIPVEEVDEVEAAREEVEEVEEVKEVEEAVEEAIEEEAMAPPAAEAGLEEEKGAILDWDQIAAEIEAKAAAGQGEAREKEELPAGLFADMAEEERVQPVAEETAEPEIAEPAAESFAKESRLTDSEEVPGAAAAQPVDERQEKAPTEAVKAEEGREDHFIFEEQGRETEPVQEVEDQPYGMAKEQCWQCGKKNRSEAPFTARSGRLYCPACLPAAEPDAVPEAPAFAEPAEGGPPQAADAVPPVLTARPRFTVGGILREAWEKTKGAKGAIWAGSAVMYLTILILAAGGSLLSPGLGQDLTADTDTATEIAKISLQVLVNAVSVLFTAGLLFMGIRKVAGDPINWKMIFTGFSDAGKIIIATILQFVMIFLGLMVLVLPGIYLAVGYSMTIPLIVDRKMSPWQAMETSRKAVHKVWWRVVGLYFVMGLLCLVSLVPLGIGLIWTWPMFVILAGVVYRYLFGSEK